MREPGVRLTQVGVCCNPECARPRFLELGEDLSEGCTECDPPREGLPTAFRLMAEAHGIAVTPGMTVGDLWRVLPDKDLNDETWL